MKKVLLGLLLLGTIAQAKITNDTVAKIQTSVKIMVKSTGTSYEEYKALTKRELFQTTDKEYMYLAESSDGVLVTLYNEYLEVITSEYLPNLNTADVIEYFKANGTRIADNQKLK